MAVVERQELAGETSITEQAQRMYLEGLKQIPGVLRVALLGGNFAADQTVWVVVPALRGDVADQVLDLERSVRRAHPGSRLEIHLKSLKERGLGPEDADSVLPQGARVIFAAA